MEIDRLTRRGPVNRQCDVLVPVRWMTAFRLKFVIDSRTSNGGQSCWIFASTRINVLYIYERGEWYVVEVVRLCVRVNASNLIFIVGLWSWLPCTLFARRRANVFDKLILWTSRQNRINLFVRIRFVNILCYTALMLLGCLRVAGTSE